MSEAASAEPGPAGAAAGAQAVPPPTALPGAGAYEVARAPGAIPVPLPAPREAQLHEGVTLAFAATGTEAEAIARTEDAGAVQASAAAPAPEAAPARPERPKTLFEALLTKAEEREAVRAAQASALRRNTENVRTASLGGAVALPGVRPVDKLPGMEPLPGVRSGGDLFGVGANEAHDEEGEVELAAIGSMTRLSPNGLRTQTDKVVVGCFPPDLVFLLKKVETHYGRPVVVTSGYRDAVQNRRAGGAKKSTHVDCMAADIQVRDVSKWDLAKYLRTIENRGGVGTYCRTNSVHIDVGPERDWHYPCRRAKKKRSA